MDAPPCYAVTGSITMGCSNCRHRLDLTLWGVWLATGCRKWLPMAARCIAYSGRLDVLEQFQQCDQFKEGER